MALLTYGHGQHECGFEVVVDEKQAMVGLRAHRGNCNCAPGRASSAVQTCRL